MIQPVPVETIKDEIERKASKVRDATAPTKGEGIAPPLEKMTNKVPSQAQGHEKLQPTYIPRQTGHGHGHLDGGGLVRDGCGQRNKWEVLVLEVKHQREDSMRRRRWIEERGCIEAVEHDGDQYKSIKRVETKGCSDSIELRQSSR